MSSPALESTADALRKDASTLGGRNATSPRLSRKQAAHVVEQLVTDRTERIETMRMLFGPDNPERQSGEPLEKWRKRCAEGAAPAGRPVSQPCGTYAAYRRHQDRGEQPCAPCREANAAYCRERRAREAAARAGEAVRIAREMRGVAEVAE